METKKLKTSVVGWFNQRGMEPLDYQPMAIITSIRSDKNKVVLAAAPNSGKTTMTICIIDILNFNSSVSCCKNFFLNISKNTS